MANSNCPVKIFIFKFLNEIVRIKAETLKIFNTDKPDNNPTSYIYSHNLYVEKSKFTQENYY